MASYNERRRETLLQIADGIIRLANLDNGDDGQFEIHIEQKSILSVDTIEIEGCFTFDQEHGSNIAINEKGLHIDNMLMIPWSALHHLRDVLGIKNG